MKKSRSYRAAIPGSVIAFSVVQTLPAHATPIRFGSDFYDFISIAQVSHPQLMNGPKIPGQVTNVIRIVPGEVTVPTVCVARSFTVPACGARSSSRPWRCSFWVRSWRAFSTWRVDSTRSVRSWRW